VKVKSKLFITKFSSIKTKKRIKKKFMKSFLFADNSNLSSKAPNRKNTKEPII
jgi:hypothetical protein